MLLNRGISAYVFCGSAGISNAGSVKTQFDRLILIAVILCPSRNPADGTFTNIPATFLFTRGFTGHEHYDKFGLINMNARLYDPFLGRFLSPDPQVQAPGYGQNYNRYTYALNNPLKYTDPDGEFWHLVIGAAIGGTVNWLAHGAKFNAQGLKYFGVGALAGALAAGVGAGVSAAFAGGSFGAGFAGTATTAAAIGFESGFAIGLFSGATNGFVSGVGNSLANGDDLGSALRNGQKQMLIQGFSGGVVGGISGGVAARLKGKDFWTGTQDIQKLKRQVIYTELANANIDKVGQDGLTSCGDACVVSVDNSLGGTLTQQEHRSWYGTDPNKDLIPDFDLWTKYRDMSNGNIGVSMWDDKAVALVAMPNNINLGFKISLSLGNPGSLDGHAVVVSRIVQRQVITRAGKALKPSLLYEIMDPAKGGHYRYLKGWQVLRARNLFYIFCK